MRYPLLSYILFTSITWLITIALKRILLHKPLKHIWVHKLVTLYIPFFFSIHFLYLYFDVNFTPTTISYLTFQYSLFLFTCLYFPTLLWVFIHTISSKISKHRKREIRDIDKTEISIQTKSSTRRKFLVSLATITAAVPFISLTYGMLQGRFSFKINKITLPFNNLPTNFNGFKIVQISDIHLGSFHGFKSRLIEMVEMVNLQKPDLIVFTGDLINNFSSETTDFTPILKQLSANIGMVAILGNHDYGDYCEWESMEQKLEEQKKIRDAFKEIGFKLLLNESITIDIKNEKIAICGVENWGKPPFPQYGDLDKASNGVFNYDFKLLLTHDPDHWEAEVVNKKPFDLTLSGHTHGFQLGVVWGGNRWSPARMKFKYWGGLYQVNNQYLYVNSGIGTLGIPARIGMPPEITTIILQKA